MIEESFFNVGIICSTEQVIPTLVESLAQDVKSRNAVVHAMSSVRDLAITIQKAGEIVKDTKGNVYLQTHSHPLAHPQYRVSKGH
jgi:hypothetical protein